LGKNQGNSSTSKGELCLYAFDYAIHSLCVVQVFADATLVFPLLVAETFARHNGDNKNSPGPKRKKRHIDTNDATATSTCNDDNSSSDMANTGVDTASCATNVMDGKVYTDCDTSNNNKVDSVGDTKVDMDCDSYGDTKTNMDSDNKFTDTHVNQTKIHEQ